MSPPSGQTITSPTSRLTITPPRVTEERPSSFSSTFHQALITKYAKQEQLPEMDKPSSSLSSPHESQQSSPCYSPPRDLAHSDIDVTDPLMDVKRNIAALEKFQRDKEVCITIDSDDDNINNGSNLKPAGKKTFR